jgi:PAS domain S-box-containing protein
MPGKDTADLKLTTKTDNKLFDILVSSVNDCAIFMTDADGYILTWNKGAKHLKGYTQKEILGKNIAVFYTAEDGPKLKKQLNLALKNDKHEYEGWQVKKDGTQFWASIILTAIYDDNKKLLGFAKFTKSISLKDESQQLSTPILKQQVATNKSSNTVIKFSETY